MVQFCLSSSLGESRVIYMEDLYRRTLLQEGHKSMLSNTPLAGLQMHCGETYYLNILGTKYGGQARW